jgi:hypothetical protein
VPIDLEMNRRFAIELLGLALLSPVVALGAEKRLDPESIPPGAVVRLAARKPPVNLAHAEVVSCTSNQITVLNNDEQFTIAANNLLSLTVLKGSTNGPPGSGFPASQGASPSSKGPGNAADPAPATAPEPPAKKSLWQKLSSLWK